MSTQAALARISKEKKRADLAERDRDQACQRARQQVKGARRQANEEVNKARQRSDKTTTKLRQEAKARRKAESDKNTAVTVGVVATFLAAVGGWFLGRER